MAPFIFTINASDAIEQYRNDNTVCFLSKDDDSDISDNITPPLHNSLKQHNPENCKLESKCPEL